MPSYAIEGVIPVVDPSAFVHPSAVLIGDVIVGPDCYIGPCAVLRGDFGRIVLHRGVNVQDTCVLHGFPTADTVLEENAHIGHGAIVHSCTVRHDALIGMNAVVLDEADVGAQSIVAAGALVRAGMHVPERTLVAGIPAKIIRELSDKDISWKNSGTAAYHQLTRRSQASMTEVVPLTEVEANRPQLVLQDVKPLIATKRLTT